MYQIVPEVRRMALLATFTTPVSHHDPTQKGQANIRAFLRRKQVVDSQHANLPDAEHIQHIVGKFPVPVSVSDIFAELTVSEFLASAIMRQFIRGYNSKDGSGLFSGIERYRRLQERSEFHAIRTTSMYQFWGGLAHDLQVGLPLDQLGDQHAAILGMPKALAQLVLVELVSNATSAIMLARLWLEADRKDDALISIEVENIDINQNVRAVIHIPAFSANSARHEIVREPGAIHLLNNLGLRFEDLDTGVASMLYNGGDLSGSAPSSAFKLARQVCQNYPLLGLLGGSTKGFILGASNLEVSAWIVCKENRLALSQFGIEPQLSAFDLLDRDEQTRHTGKRVEGSPIPYGFETLVAGTQLVVDLRLRPYATDLEIGALVASVTTYLNADSTLGGQSARGFGLQQSTVIKRPDVDLEAFEQAYEQYLSENADMLRTGLVDGTLGTDKKLF